MRIICHLPNVIKLFIDSDSGEVSMSDKQIRAVDFTMPEIKFYLEYCNFTEAEEELFLLRCRKEHYTMQAVALKMNVSLRTATKINKSVKRKIRKVAPLFSQWVDQK